MRDSIRFFFVAVTLSVAVAACGEADDQLDDIDRQTPTNEQQAEAPDTPMSVPASSQSDLPAEEPPDTDTVAEPADDEQAEPIQVQLLAGKQLEYPEAWMAHAAANESECGHTSCPYTVTQSNSQPEDIPPFDRGAECMVDGGVVVDGGQNYQVSAQAGAAQADFTTDVSGGDNFVELALQGQASAKPPIEGGVRSDAGATLFSDESALVLDVRNPTGEPVELEVVWDLSGEPVEGEASWQGSLWYTDSASRLDDCYVAPDYEYDRVFDVFQDVQGAVRGQPSGSTRIALSADEHIQLGLRFNVGAHAVGRAGSDPQLAQASQSRVNGTVRFQVVPAQQDTNQ